MDTRQLAAFCAVVERRSFSQAAERLGVTQPAVSLQVRALEERLGRKLLDRSGRRVEPTEAGLRVYLSAQRLLQIEEQLFEELALEEGVLTGRLAIGASTGPGGRLVPLLVCEFAERHPAVRVALSIFDTQTVIEQVAGRELELGIVGARRRVRSLTFEPFLRDEIVLAVPPGHPLGGRTADAAELEGETLIEMQEGAGVRQVVEEELRRAGIRLRPRARLELGLQESVKSAVAAGHGVAFISRTALEGELTAGTLAAATLAGLQPSRQVYLVRSSSRVPTRAAEAFVAFARERSEKDPAARRPDPPGSRGRSMLRPLQGIGLGGSMKDDWRLTIDFDEERDGADLLERLGARRFAADERKRLGDRVIVSRDAARVYLYAESQAQVSEVENVVRSELTRQRYRATVSVVERWHPVEQVWKDASIPLPGSEAELEEERDRLEEREAAESLAAGRAEWEVRVELPGHAETVDLAERLEEEGIPVVRRHTYLLVGAVNEDEARALAERLRSEAPSGARIHVQPGGEMVWEVTPQNPFAVLGGLGG
jgi:DNA-binding transcriptional LysR family regulator